MAARNLRGETDTVYAATAAAEAIDDTVDVLIADWAHGAIATVFVHTQQWVFRKRAVSA